MTPAAPASAEPMKNVEAITRSTSIPIIEAASRSNDVARIALPIFVRATSSVSPTINPIAETIVSICGTDRKTSPIAVGLGADQVERVVVAEVRAEEQQRAVLQEERHAEGADQGRDAGRIA